MTIQDYSSTPTIRPTIHEMYMPLSAIIRTVDASQQHWLDGEDAAAAAEQVEISRKLEVRLLGRQATTSAITI